MDDLSAQSEKVNFVPCIKWVKQGVAKPTPEKVQLTKEELKPIILNTDSKLSIYRKFKSYLRKILIRRPYFSTTSKGDGEEAATSSTSNQEDEFNMDKYDDKDDVNKDNLGVSSLAVITPAGDEGNSDSYSEKEYDIIKPDDNLILVGHVEGDANILEVYVYNENESSLYVHHDLLLPSAPICFEWLDYRPGQTSKGNYCAIGSTTTIIDIWDLDVVNCVKPAFTLGQRGSRRKLIPHIGHADAVFDLAWNRNLHHILASSSVDEIILWDLDEGKPHTTLENFKDKVQCLKWHEQEAQSLLAGSCDKTAKIFDCRNDSSFKSWNLDGEAERVIWDPHESYCFLVGTSAGSVQCFDSRQGLLWSLSAHEQEVTGLVSSPTCKGLMVTSSSDGTLKTWDYSCTSNKNPVLVHTKAMNMKKILCLEFCPDLPFVVASGGDNKSNNFSVLDLRTIDTVIHTFGSKQLSQLQETPIDVEMENLSINN